MPNFPLIGKLYDFAVYQVVQGFFPGGIRLKMRFGIADSQVDALFRYYVITGNIMILDVKKKIIALCLSAGMSLWFLDALLDFYYKHPTETFIQSLLYDEPIHELFARIFLSVVVMVLGFVISGNIYLRKSRDELDLRVQERTAELEKANVDLENLNTQLLDTNRAVSTFAQNIERQKDETEKKIALKLRNLIMPMVVKLKNDKDLARYEGQLDMLTMQIENLTSGFTIDSSVAAILSFTELRIASLVKNGITNAEIARQLHISESTVRTHRKNIRKKLKINNAKYSLRNFLNSSA